MNPYKVLIELEEITDNKDKLEFLANNCSPELKFILQMALSPYITFGVSSFEFAEPVDHNDFTKEWDRVPHLLTTLSTRSSTGSKAIEFIKETSKTLNAHQQDILKRILNKNLQCGIDIKIANKVFPDLIKEFSLQYPVELKKGVEVIFPSVAEIRYKGRRSISIVNVNDVRHFDEKGKLQNDFSCFDKELVGISGGLSIVFDGIVIDTIVVSDPTNSDKIKNVEKVIKYILFDMMPLGNYKKQKCNNMFTDRTSRLRSMVANFQSKNDNRDSFVKASRLKRIKDQSELDIYFKDMVKKKHSGLVIKNINGLYEFKKSSVWIEMKADAKK